MPLRSSLLVSAVALAGIAAFVALRRPTPAPVPALSASQSASAPVVSAAPPLPPWPDNPVTVDCAPFAPSKASTPAPAQPSAAGVLVAKTRSFGASAMTCGGTGVAVTAIDRAALATALAGVARMKLSPIARAVLQNAALRLARCARAAGGSAGAPTAAALASLKDDAKRLARRLALDPRTLATLEAPGSSLLAEWLGEGEAGRAAVSASTALHARASGFTLVTRALGTVHGNDAFSSDLVVVDTEGAPRVLPIPAELVLRRTMEQGITVCIAGISDPTASAAPALLPLRLSVEELGPIRCDRCHARGRRLTEASGAGSPPASDRAALDDLAAWYAEKSG